MIIIHSVDHDGRLFTGEKQHFYIDADLLRERAAGIRERFLLDKIAAVLGWSSFDSLALSALTMGTTRSVLVSCIVNGNVPECFIRRRS